MRADDEPSDTGSEDAVAARLQALEGMTYDELRVEWRRLYRAHPPKRVSRDLLMLGAAWKVQERAYGPPRPRPDIDIRRSAVRGRADAVAKWPGLAHTGHQRRN